MGSQIERDPSSTVLVQFFRVNQHFTHVEHMVCFSIRFGLWDAAEMDLGVCSVKGFGLQLFLEEESFCGVYYPSSWTPTFLKVPLPSPAALLLFFSQFGCTSLASLCPLLPNKHGTTTVRILCTRPTGARFHLRSKIVHQEERACQDARPRQDKARHAACVRQGHAVS